MHVPFGDKNIKERSVYSNIDINGSFKDIFCLPKQAPKHGLHFNILRALNMQKKRIEDSELMLRLPEIWRTRCISGWSDGTELELPEECIKLIAPEIKETEIISPNLIAIREVNLQGSEQPSTPERKTQRLVELSPNSPFQFPSLGSVALSAERIEVVQGIIKKHDFNATPEDAHKLKSLLIVENDRRLDHAAFRALFYNSGLNEKIKFATIESIKKGDIEKRRGDATINDDAEDRNITPINKVHKWGSFIPMVDTDLPTRNGDRLNETLVETKVGPLLQGFFSSSMGLRETMNQSMPLMNPLRFFATTPRADYAVRLSGEEWREWTDLMSLNLMSGEGKTHRNYAANDGRTAAQLAMNSVATLIIFILMYLSTRRDTGPNDPDLPAWMFTMSFVYTERGFTIYAHYPKFTGRKWEFASWKITQNLKDVLSQKASRADRVRCLAAFLLMRSHTLFVREQIKTWSQNLPPSVVPLMKILIARAHLEMVDASTLQEGTEDGI